MYETIVYSKVDSIGIMQFNRPKALNTISRKMLQEISNCIEAVNTDNKIHAILIWGTETLFGAGADVKDNAVDPNEAHGLQSYRSGEAFQKMTNTIERCKKPTIAAIGGYCLGGSFEIALACDIRVVSKNAKIGLTELKLGVLPGGGGTQRLPKIVGASIAKEMLYTGDKVSGEEAYRIGIANHIAEEGALYETAMKLAEKVARGAPLAVELVKKLVDYSLEGSMEKGLALECAANSVLAGTKDQTEGGRAFVEKRSPVFEGR